MRSFDRGDLQTFVGEHYGPGQMILAAAGAVDHDAIVGQAEALFGGMASQTPQTPEPACFTGGEVRQEKPLEQAHFALAFEAPDYCDPSIYTAQIYSNALGGGMSSRLFQEIRERRGLCYTIFAQTSAFSDTGLITIYAGTSEAELPGLAQITIDEMRRAADDMSDAEVARAPDSDEGGAADGAGKPVQPG